MNKHFNQVLNQRKFVEQSTGRKLFAITLACTVFFSGCKKINPDDPLLTDATQSKAESAKTSAGADFTIAVIPDTQYYVAQAQLGGIPAMFNAQTAWIMNNRVAENIVYVAHLGDIVDHGDDPSTSASEWGYANTALSTLETAYTGYPNGIPYGLVVGNHDQYPNGHPLTSTTTKYNQYYGTSHFSGRSYYGGNYSTNNDNHYDLFSAGGLNFIVIYIEYDNLLENSTNLNTWAYNLAVTYASRKVIVVSHTIMGNNVGAGNNDGTPGSFSVQGQAIYDRLKSRPNIFMMLNGHHGANGEGFRQDTYSGRTIKTFLSDYQGRANGGGGLMRLYKISVNNDLISVRTINPYTGGSETDGDSQFKKPLFHEETTTRKCDFNQDGLTEHAFFNAGVWKVSGVSNVTYGSATQGDIPVPMDYNADGKTELAVWRPTNFTWYIKLTPEVTSVYGTTGDIPVPGDYDGDGKADIAMYRPSTNKWWIQNQTGVVYGDSGVIPVPGDYNGDGKIDPAYYKISTGMWNVMGQITNKHYGDVGYIPVPGDYNGDGTTNVAIFNPATGIWHLDSQVPNVTVVAPQAGDIPAPGDYFGDGKTHPAIYRPSTGVLYKYNNGVVTTSTFGGSGDKLLNLPYHIRKFFFP